MFPKIGFILQDEEPGDTPLTGDYGDELPTEGQPKAEVGATPEVPAAKAEEPAAKAEEPEKAPEEPKKPKVAQRIDKLSERARAAERKAKELEAKLAEIEGKGKAPAKPDPSARLSEIDTALLQAISDGDTKTAGQLMAEQRQLQQQMFEARLNEAAKNSSTEAKEDIRYEQTLSAFETAFPMINPESEDFDEDKTAEVSRLVEAFTAAGNQPADALKLAMNYAFPEGAQNVKSIEDARKKTNVEKNIKTAQSMPPSMDKVGTDSSKAGAKPEQPIDVTRMSEEDFDALPEETKARLRGDFYEG